MMYNQKLDNEGNPLESNAILDNTPLYCSQGGHETEIEANIHGVWETIARVNTVGDFEASDIAASLVKAANEYKKMRQLMRSVIAIFEENFSGNVVAMKNRGHMQSVLREIKAFFRD